MAFIIRVNYNKEFLFKTLHVNKFFYINLINNEKLHYRHSRWFSSSTTPDPSVLSSRMRPAESDEKSTKLTNPIFEKFEKLLNTLSVKQGNDFEFPTNFGSVRFDSDINFTSLNNKMSLVNENPQSNYDSTNNYIEDIYFNNSISHDIHKINGDKSSISCNELNDQELNYIDNQYLKVDSISETNTSDIYNSEMRPDISALNFIDSQIEGLPNQAVAESKLDANDIFKEKLSCYYSFEDSIDETSEEKFIKKVIKHDNNINDDHWREALENKLLSMTEDGSKYLREINQSQMDHKKLKVENNYEIIEEQNTSSSFDEDKLKSEPEELKEEKQDNTKSAWSFVKEIRREEMISSQKEIKGEILENERYKRILLAVPSFSLHSTYDLAKELKANILYQNEDFLAISKPYGIPVHGGGNKANDRLNIVNALPTLAELINVKKLEPVHRLDMNVTGVMLLAKTDKMAEDLKRMFKQHKIKKSYCAIVKGVPENFNGVIDIPIGEGKVEKFKRMVLRPDTPNFRGKPGQSKKAITRYKVVSSVPGAALLEVNPITGIKHQIRVHLGFGINCPIIGDHKYSYLTKIVPQKLPAPVLHKLGMEQSKVRALPMLLHSFVVTLPIIGERGTEIVIAAVPPKFFRIALKCLKLSSMRSRLTNEYSDIIFGNRNDEVRRE